MDIPLALRLALIKSAVVCGLILLSVLSLWVVPRRSPFRGKYLGDSAYVDYGVLTALHPSTSTPANSTTTSSIRYQLSLNITIRTNGIYAVWYRYCSATALYNGTMLGAPQEYWITSEDQNVWRVDPSRRMAWTDVSFRGTMAVYPSVAAELARERAAGTVHVRVGLSVTVVRRWSSKSTRVEYSDLDCWLWFPPPARDDAAPAFFGEGTSCWPVK